MQFSYKLTNTDIYAQLLYRIHTDDAQKLDSAGLLKIVKKAVQKQNKFLKHTECNILIFADTFATIPEQGIGGRCGQSDIINIFIDTKHNAGVKHNIEKWLPSALAHELYHARWYKTHKWGGTLGESLIEEGLATMFEEFIQPSKKVSYAHHLNKEELAQSWQKAKPVLDARDYNRDDWFYGGDGIKKWTGYSLGYEIVQRYIIRHSKENPATIVDIDPQKIIKDYLLD